MNILTYRNLPSPIKCYIHSDKLLVPNPLNNLIFDDDDNEEQTAEHVDNISFDSFFKLPVQLLSYI